MRNMCSPIELLPFQGVASPNMHPPRAIPWAMSLQPFQGRGFPKIHRLFRSKL